MRDFEPLKPPILVVDDDDELRDVMMEILNRAGHRVLMAENGRDALFLMTSSPRPALVLLDLEMPEMNGQQFLKNVRKDARLAEIPILLVSSEANPENSRGLSGFMKKPIDTVQLLNRVDELISSSHSI